MRLRFAFSALVVALVASPAYAHFHLNSPDSFQTQDSAGDPQKAPPCGDTGTPSNLVATLMEGAQIPITITETVFHPGHYRVSIAQTQAELPPEPLVTPGDMACGTVPIDPNPSLPVLADGELVHTASFGGKPQTMMVQLPPGMLCNNCVLQVIEFMSEHPLNVPGGCFYHHCAMVNIVANAPDAGVIAGGGDAGGGMNPQDAVGGCCSTGSSLAGNGVAILIVGGVLLLRRRRTTAV